MPDLDRDGVSIHFEISGNPSNRAPLLLTHGYSASSAMWAPNLAALGESRQVVTWDVRGHGRSASPVDPSRYTEDVCVADMAAVLDACGFTRAVIGGLSLGGYLSLAFHLAHPDRVTALLLLDTGPSFKNDRARQAWNETAEAFAVAFEQRGNDALNSSPEVVAGPHDPNGLACAARGILTQRNDRVIASLPDVAVPTLVLVGENDQPFLAATDYLSAKIPGATKVVIPDAGHASNLDQPDAVNEAITTFLLRTGRT